MPEKTTATQALLRYAAISALAIAACVIQVLPARAGETPAARGKYIVHTSGCMDCHTPLKMGANGPEPDMSRLFSGHPEGLAMPPVPTLPPGPWVAVASGTNTAWAGPWGVSFTANLTPDRDTGLGQWTADDFRKTVRTGRHMGRGRAILPPMPIPVYNNFTDRDLDAIFAYLRTIPPIKNRVPEPWAPGTSGTPAKTN